MPSESQILTAFNEIHKKSLELLRSLPDSALEEENHGDLEISARRNKRTSIMHCCRHESFHSGQIGLLLKMQGVKVI